MSGRNSRQKGTVVKQSTFSPPYWLSIIRSRMSTGPEKDSFSGKGVRKSAIVTEQFQRSGSRNIRRRKINDGVFAIQPNRHGPRRAGVYVSPYVSRCSPETRDVTHTSTHHIRIRQQHEQQLVMGKFQILNQISQPHLKSPRTNPQIKSHLSNNKWRHASNFDSNCNSKPWLPLTTV